MHIDSNTLKFYPEVLKESIVRFFDDDMPMHAAALSYYMVFSLPSMLLIVLWTSARFYDEVAVREAIFAKIGGLVGHQGAGQIMATLEKLSVEQPTFWSTALGLGILLFFATSVFDAMRTALNKIANVQTSDSVMRSIWKLLRIRFIAFALLVSISFILLVSMVIHALITKISDHLVSWFGEVAEFIVAFDFILLELGTISLLFALYFRYLPDNRLRWRDIWLGAALTAGLLIIGKSLIAFFIGNSTVAHLYDAAGSILVLMLWVYYSSAILLLGATFTFTRAELLNNGRDKNARSFARQIRRE
jgi:membrane protein